MLAPVLLRTKLHSKVVWDTARVPRHSNTTIGSASLLHDPTGSLSEETMLSILNMICNTNSGASDHCEFSSKPIHNANNTLKPSSRLPKEGGGETNRPSWTCTSIYLFSGQRLKEGKVYANQNTTVALRCLKTHPTHGASF